MQFDLLAGNDPEALRRLGTAKAVQSLRDAKDAKRNGRGFDPRRHPTQGTILDTRPNKGVPQTGSLF